MVIEIILAIAILLLAVSTAVFMTLYFRTKSVLDKRIYEMKVARDESLNIIEEIRDDLRSGRVLLKIDRIDGSNLYLRR